MDNILLIDPLKDRNWDRFVMDHPFGWITHLAGWKRVLESSFAHMHGYYLVLPDHTGTRIKAALSLYMVENCLKGKKLISTPFATLSDPLVSTCEDLEKLTNAAIHLAYELEASTIEIRTFSSSPLISDKRFSRHNLYKTHSLHLDEDPTQLMRTFHRSCVRQKIQQANRSNICLKRGKNEADLQQFYKLYVISRRRLGLPPQPYLFFKMIWETFFPANQVMLLFAEKDGKTIAGLILFKFKDRVSAEFSFSDLKYRTVHPNHFLYWEAIKLAYDEGFEYFDFGRTSLSNKTLDQFKNRWGTKEIHLQQFFYPESNIPNGFCCEGSIRNCIAREIFKHIPLSSLIYIGDLYYSNFG